MSWFHYIDSGKKHNFKNWKVYIAYRISELEQFFINGRPVGSWVIGVHLTDTKEYFQKKDVNFISDNYCIDKASLHFNKEELKSYIDYLKAKLNLKQSYSTAHVLTK
jgi:hypothetical protein